MKGKKITVHSQGILYNQLFSILLALIIGQCVFFLLAFVIMMLAAAKIAPLSWILYDVDQYVVAKEETKARRRGTQTLTSSGRLVPAKPDNPAADPDEL